MKKLLISLMLIAAAGILTGCSPKENTDSMSSAPLGAETVQKKQERVGIEVVDEHMGSLEELLGLLGMEDSQTADLFGGGEENWTEDEQFYIGRTYRVQLYEETLPVYTSCDEQKTVNSVSVWISDGEHEVTQEEVEQWVQRITSVVGTDPSYYDTQSEMESGNWKWISEGKIVSIHWRENLLSINMNTAMGELR